MEAVVSQINLKNEARTKKKRRNPHPSARPTCWNRGENSGLEGEDPECKGSDHQKSEKSWKFIKFCCFR